MPRSTVWPPRLLAVVMALAAQLTACSDDDPGPRTPRYLPQTSEDNVLENLITAYEARDIAAYSRLFANDFQFYHDPRTREQLGIEFWTRTSDSLRTEALFSAPNVTRIELAMDWQRGSATGSGTLPPRETWTRLFVDTIVLEVDVACPNEGTRTCRCQNQQQRFHFRRGCTYPPSGPADTLTYLVEWRDPGTDGPVEPDPDDCTWSRIRQMEYQCE
jgi:hypothetical protein